MFQPLDNRGEWRFQRRYQLLASGAPDGGFGGSGGGNPRTVTLGELVDCHDEEFVRNAYRKLLGREADAAGLANALEHLRSGGWNKIDLLGSLRYSEEGRRVGVEVAGLRIAYLVRRLFRVPVVGYLLRSAEILLSLPRVLGNMERFEAFTNARLTALQAGNRQRSGAQSSAVLAQIEQQQAAREKMQEQLGVLERSVRDIANVLFLSDGELLEAADYQGSSAREVTLDSAIEDLRGTMMGHAPALKARTGASSAAPAPDPRVGELAERIDALAAETVGFHRLLESAQVDWASTLRRLGEVAKSAEGNHVAVSLAKKQQEGFRKKQERLEQALQSLRWDIKEAGKRAAAELRGDLEKRLAEAGAQNQTHEALRMDLVRSQMELQEQIAGEIGSREMLALELRGLLGQFEASIAQLRLAAEKESGQLGRRIEAEIAVREALLFESRQKFGEVDERVAALGQALERESGEAGRKLEAEIAARETLLIESRQKLGEVDQRIAALGQAMERGSEEMGLKLEAEIAAREVLMLESRQKLGEVDQRVAALGQALERESGEAGRKLEAEIAAREALLIESRQKLGEVDQRVAALGQALERESGEAGRKLEAEIAAREALLIESRQKLGEVDQRVAALGQALERESGETGRKLEAEIAAREALASQSKASADEIRATSESVLAELGRHTAQFAEEGKAREWLGGHFNEEFEKRQELEARFKEVELAAHQTRSDLTYTDWRISTFVAEARKRLPSPLDQRQLQHIVDEHDNHSLDSLYAAFEDAFRGSREDIKARQAVYLPYIKNSKVGSTKAPIVDLGCGRGEWLELLREQKLTARGVDSNRIMVKRCTELGLQARLSDAHSCLSKLKDASIGCVTGFHIVEHMPFGALIELFDEVVRVLQPGGLVIFETPNPSNILVGSTEFYNDPTHNRPLPPRVLRFLAESRGLCKVEILELHPYPTSYTFEADETGVAQRLNQYFYGPQDYSIIGRKP
jgi:SAM-dependent methyltransferase